MRAEEISLLSDERYDSSARILDQDSSAICYASDDSGVRISTNSEQITVGQHKRKHHSGETLEKPGEMIDILIVVKDNIEYKVSANEDKLLDIILKLAKHMPGRYTTHLKELERNILQMNSPARSLAVREIKINTQNKEKHPNKLQKEMKAIYDQLGDAKAKSKHLRDKLGKITTLKNVC